MTRTGPRSHTEPRPAARARTDGRRRTAAAVALCAFCFLSLAWAGAAVALDVFTLWRLPEAPLRITAGDRVDYLGTSIEAGRRRVEALRIQCVGETDAAWLIEILPLDETPDGHVPVPGEGLRLAIDRALAGRAGALVDHVLEVAQWRDGHGEVLPREQWRDDPLTGAFLEAGFVPDTREEQGQTTRVVGEADLLCAQFTLSAGDTTRIDLPRGEMIQIHRREISAAVHDTIPFLGLAYAAERAETRSELVPAGRRAPPPPSLRVEIMELLDFGADATVTLTGVESSF